MEQEIMNIIIKLIYNDRMEELYNNKSKSIEFPIKCTFPPNYKVLTKFSNEYFFNYEQILLENAIIYALKNNEIEYLNFLKNNIKNIRKSLEEELSFRIKTSSLALENIKEKLINKTNNDTKIKTQHNTLFQYIKNTYTIIEPITITYRNIFLNFLNQTKNEDKEILLDNLLLTNNFDNLLIEQNKNIINKNNIKRIKNILIRLIFFDNFLYLENNESINEYIDEYDEFDYEEENTTIMEDEILNYINESIKIDKFILPNNNELRLNLYSYFISYNLYLKENYTGYETLKKDKEKKLQKINPLYKLENINLNIKK